MKSDTKIGIFVVLVLVGVVVILLGREVLNRKNADQDPSVAETAPPAEGTDMAPELMAERDAISGEVAPPEMAEAPVVDPGAEMAETGLEAAPAPPVPSLAEVPSSQVPAPQEYVVQPGDTLEKISKACYGKKSQWRTIAEANPGINPNNLKVGAKLSIPPAPVSAPAAVPENTMNGGMMTAARTYTIKSGDTLEKISKSVYGRKSQWQVIAAANPGINPNNLKVGAVISIPEAPAASATPVASPAAPAPHGNEPWKSPGATKLVTAPRG